jgi:hypothetical protein
VSVSRARELLAQAGVESDRLQRHLLVAAALREVLGREPIVVGGTAEDLYTGDVYVETDLDLCGWVSPEEHDLLRSLGFTQEGRHWFHARSKIAVEFPETTIDGDEARVVHRAVGSGIAAVIGVDDLYLDRIRQATVDERNPDSEAARAALAVAVASYDEIDWRYVERTIKATERDNSPLGKPMGTAHRVVRRRLLAALKR